MTVSTFRVVCRTLGVAHFANSPVILNRTKQFQGYQCYHGINRVSKEAVQGGVFGSMDWNKKRKSGTLVWRQISTQSSPNKDCSMEDVVTEPVKAANIEQGENKSNEAEETVVSSSSTSLNDVQNDSEDIAGNSSAGSVAQDIAGGQDARKTNKSKAKYAVSVEVAVGSSVMRFIKGTDGSTQKVIEDMGVKIFLPTYKKGDTIVIKGDSMDDIAKASQKIQSIIDEAAKTPALGYSHFISLPLAIHPEFVDKVAKFQSTILGHGDRRDSKRIVDGNSRAGASGYAGKTEQSKNDLAVGVTLKVDDDENRVKVDIHNIPTVSYAPKATKSVTLHDLRIDESIFLKPQRLHLTVLMLKLWNKQRILAAMDVLKGICAELNEVLDNRPLFVRLNGLDLMRGSEEKAQVLYAPVEEVGDEGRLTRACQIITDAYVRAGLVFEDDAKQKLKLHATLMNTTFRTRSRDRRNDKSFDARGILKQFGSEEWGEYHIREAHLSQRFVYDDNGYYHCCTSIPLPDNTQVVWKSSSEPSQADLEVASMAETA